ncbi:hypothetical protein MMC13_006974 [Lambiella insularis]|nr:hypothetical protein [Lambiella insularis]
MPMTWDQKNVELLFHHALGQNNISLDYGRLAEAMGPDCTKRAIGHQIQKFRNLTKTYTTTTADTETNGEAATTPGSAEAPDVSKVAKAPATKVAANGDSTDATVPKKRGRKPAGEAKAPALKKGAKRSANGNVKSKEIVTAEDDEEPGVKTEVAIDTSASQEDLPVSKKVKVEGPQIKVEEGTPMEVTDAELLGEDSEEA